jgi:NifU-like protein
MYSRLNLPNWTQDFDRGGSAEIDANLHNVSEIERNVLGSKDADQFGKLKFNRLYSKKIDDRMKQLRYVGYFLTKQAEEKGMRLVTARKGDLCLYWLVDESDGVIADAKFQVYGPPALVALADLVSELSIRKTYDQVSRFSAELLDRHLDVAFPPYLNQVLEAIDSGVHQCLDIPFAVTHDTSPIDLGLEEIPGGLPGWSDFSIEKKRAILEEVLTKEVRPYIELDAGTIRLVELKGEGEVVIEYGGSCTTCHSSTGSTLSAIQQILRARVHPSLFVSI